jgi:acyl-CoA dehydrogenase
MTAVRAVADVTTLDVDMNYTARAEAVAKAAAAAALEVDRDSRFPQETFAEAREQRLLGIMVPRELGGEGADIATIANICYRLGQACSSSAMIFAMHQIKVACIVRHCHGSDWHAQVLRRLVREQLLFASSTTEGQKGGATRTSDAPVKTDGDRFTLDRKATVISYGAQADGVVTTARRSADAAGTDQVLVVLLKENYTLNPIMSWDTLGMRGTCSAGFELKAAAGTEQILPVPYEKIHPQTMTPVAHLTWASVWAGIAAAAVERARQFIRAAARQSGGQMPPAAAHYTKATASLNTLRGMVAAAIERYEAARDDEQKLMSLDFQTMINLTKVEASEGAVETVMHAMRACGLSGYRNDSDHSIGRHLRDVLSSPLMINNDRILANVANASLMSPVAGTITA